MQLPEELTPTILDANPALLTHKRRRGCMFFFFISIIENLCLSPSLSQAIHLFDGLAGAVVQDGHFIVTSPNRRLICHPPLGGDHSVFLRKNLRYGDDDLDGHSPFSKHIPIMHVSLHAPISVTIPT